LPLPGFLKFEGKLFDFGVGRTFDLRFCEAGAGLLDLVGRREDSQLVEPAHERKPGLLFTVNSVSPG
jgi:hypothetical protein